MTNNNNLYELPKTVTVSYFDVETGQNLTTEEWQRLHPANSDEIKIINKSGSNFVSEKGEYGPCSECCYNSIKFELNIVLKNVRGSWRSRKVHNIVGAIEAASEILGGVGHWASNSSGTFDNKQRGNLVIKINEAICEHINSCKNIDKTVENKTFEDEPCIQS